MLLSQSKNSGTKIWLFVIVDATKKDFFYFFYSHFAERSISYFSMKDIGIIHIPH